MGKFSIKDKMRIQTLCEQGLGYKRIAAAYPEKNWKLRTIQDICKRFKERGSATERKVGSGRPISVRTDENIEKVSGLICSQEGRPGTSKSTRAIAKEVGISQKSVLRIAKKDLGLSCFKRTTVQVLNVDTKLKRLVQCNSQLRRLPVHRCKCVFFTDEKAFYVDPPVSMQNDRCWARGKKRDISAERLLVQHSKFSQHVMVSAGVCFGGRGRLHFVPDKTKVNAGNYIANLLPSLIQDCHNLLQQDFVFQQDEAPAHTAHQTPEWLEAHCPDYVKKDQWPPNSPDLNPLDYCVWGLMLAEYKKHRPKPSNKAELKAVLQTIWDSLPQESIDKAVLGFRKRLLACVRVDGGHFEHVL